ncbi:MAG: sulfite exporter TauE/SafE family protein [Bacteroidia bacterium]|jgi:hypothetical protein
MEAVSSISFSRLMRWYIIVIALLILTTITTVSGVYLFAGKQTFQHVVSFFQYFIQEEFFNYLLVGIVAQLIDGSLGMAYGVSSTSFLISTGVSPATASASVHIAEVFTSGISGISHWKFGNIDRNMFKKLVIPGAIGAALGAYFLTSFDGDLIKPYISVYLLIMGFIILAKAARKTVAFKNYRHMRKLALLGGFIDASGGGGWGPVVTTTLIGSGKNQKRTIGTVNAVEFLVALTASGIFTLFIGINSWLVIAGLIVGGAIAAPIGAYVCHKINVRAAMSVIGLLIIFLSIRTILKSVGIL